MFRIFQFTTVLFCSSVKTLIHLQKKPWRLFLEIEDQGNRDAILCTDNQIQPNQVVSLISERLGVGMWWKGYALAHSAVSGVPAVCRLYGMTFLHDTIRRSRGARANSKKLSSQRSRSCCFVCLARPRSYEQLFIPTGVDWWIYWRNCVTSERGERSADVKVDKVTVSSRL